MTKYYIMNNIKIDLHTHSILSPDGGLGERDYQVLLEKKILDCIAVTDHNRIDFALSLQHKLGSQIIVGEEIMTKDGEIIGLFLTNKIASGMSARDTVDTIKKQKGLVYIPHPFETLRKGISEHIFQLIVNDITIVEVFNGRSMQPATRILAKKYVSENNLGKAASSDAHCRIGIGNTYSMVSNLPEKATLVKLLRDGSLHEVRASLLAYLCPKFNRFKKMLKSPFAQGFGGTR